MNYVALMKSATMGRPERLRPLILWTVFEYFLRGAPYGILLLILWELFKPLQQPGTALDLQRIWLVYALLLIMLVLLFVVSRKAYFIAYKDSYEICADGRLAIAAHLRKLSMGFYNTRDPGDIGAYLVSDYANIEQMISHLFPQICGAIAAPTTLILCLLFINWKLALAAALVIPLAWPAAWISFRIILYFGKWHQKYKVAAASRMIEYIQTIRLIKAFNLKGEKFDRLEQSFRNLKIYSIRLEASVGPTVLFSAFILHGGLVVIILFGLTLLMAGELSLPFYIMFLVLGARIYEPLLNALVFMAELHYYSLGVDRVENLRKTAPLQAGQSDLQIRGHNIRFDKVSFSYNTRRVLSKIDLNIPEHALTALVGPSGSGKTTLTRLIARFWDVDHGQISLDGRDIRDYSNEQLMANLSMVFQDVYLFNDTILNNIRIGKPEANREEIIAAAQKACCHNFISALPLGYDTMVGESGSTLSGGEKQRISIARALLKDAPIILLDEATAALDPENEVHLQAAIDELVCNKTVVVIAHRLNTIARADQIVVLEQGRIVELGKHDDLLQKNGLYTALWNEQQRMKGWKF